MAIKRHASFAVHPGPWLRTEIVEPAGLTVTALASRLRVTRQAASNPQRNSGVFAEMAIRFEKAFGIKADTLMRMQAAHEPAQARMREDEIVVEAAERARKLYTAPGFSSSLSPLGERGRWGETQGSP